MMISQIHRDEASKGKRKYSWGGTEWMEGSDWLIPMLPFDS
jgi:hypothetical protein